MGGNFYFFNYVRGSDDVKYQQLRTVCHYYFLSRLEILERARALLDLALMDDEASLLLLELKIECCQMLDDATGLKKAYHAMTKAYPARGIDLNARCQGLFSTILQEPDNFSLILELVKLLSYQFNFPHARNVIKEALKRHPAESRLHRLSALIHRLDDEPEEALAALQEAVRLNPKDFIAASALRSLEAHLEGNGDKTTKEVP